MAFINTDNNFKKIEGFFGDEQEVIATYSVKPDLFQITTFDNESDRKNRYVKESIQLNLNGLKTIDKIIRTEYPQLFLTPDCKVLKVRVSLFDKSGNVQYGLNWGQREKREPNQAYIQLPVDVYRSDFFPKKPEHFSVRTDDGQDIIFTRAQKTDEGTALQTPEDNSLFGKYLRTRMGIPLGDEITKEAILRYGCKEITFFKVGNQYFMDFSGNSKINIDSEHFESAASVPFSLTKFTNNEQLFTRYIRSLLAKPFVILSGNSGTGKTRIATRFAEYLEKTNDTGIKNSLLIPVGADWTDNTKILGYYNPLANNGAGEYVKTDVFRFIETAGANPNIPFFLILDEMNLSHVERYFSDFLSKMELLDFKSDKKVFFDIQGYGQLELPKNLFITGTVNIDETTYMFSPKVLDRANVIEFKPEMDDVLKNLIPDTSTGEDGKQKSADAGVAEGFMQLANKVRSGEIPEDVQPVLNDIKPILEVFYKELEKCGFEFAYRTAKEIRLYAIAAYKTAENGKIPSATEIADIQILQKILPKIHGNKKQIGTLLDELEKLCEEKSLPNSLAKIRQMKDKLNRFQYASFI
jgi:MoxR-like ATPase